MRGKAVNGIVKYNTLGITPAYAGKSSAFICSSPVNQDHPRLCGEKGISIQLHIILTGSPPPMRGKGQHQYIPVQERGITPAYAGKSGRGSAGGFLYRDHPRLCGEKFRN